ncbi:MAG: FMN-binding protein [Flintibacter sp.]|uniref:FMN-binding protein n=1 Tax=Flintibacter sp. TaxID=1918624 RepID=UPI002670D785|nr:FMN-binding protein [Flintibacter sp.]MCI6149170.1 FMN-binding protein [Flintibacter sp.]MDD7115988.1 FMN-binding protein [Flintibacter sp.]MDY5038627.1 FMN-binding protein [Lawsonibacter sp.]
MSNWNKIFKPIVVLVIICIVITGALAATNSVTDPIIDEATRVAQQKARTELLPEAEDFEPVTGVEVENVSDIYASTNDVGVIITSSAKGYGGDVVVMTAFNPDGTIKQIKVTEQAETKGIGSKVVATPSYWENYMGLDASDALVLNEDVDAVTSATISSTALINAVNSAIEAYNAIP